MINNAPQHLHNLNINYGNLIEKDKQRSKRIRAMVGHSNGFSQETHTKPSKWLIPLLLQLP